MVSFSDIHVDAQASLFIESEDTDSISSHDSAFYGPFDIQTASEDEGAANGSHMLFVANFAPNDNDLFGDVASDTYSFESDEQDEAESVDSIISQPNVASISINTGSEAETTDSDEVDELDATDNEEYSDAVLKAYKKLLLPLEVQRFNNKNPTMIDFMQVLGCNAFRKQCKIDWRRLPFDHHGVICPSKRKIGSLITALCWSNVGQPYTIILKMKFLKSHVNQIGHYPDRRYNHCKLIFIAKITLKLDDSFNVDFSLYWREACGVGSLANTRTLAVMRHNLMAPDVFSSLIASQIQLVREHMTSNWTKYWGMTTWYDIS
ncbi:hypothetical protein M422DRAFT_247381 [Sphaerobolus stellatus SS14]|uniref:Uncharacterized protein n=1 Tax=Sphaerobolus stellatus (strain SS14) TaxID=990650 RepID=A0A0C9TNQ2_SPHS4|nr:hypothetical protein M422DRAFT_275887 [Sphaerobolus stellatus SS14]KIJ48533.1 hypothetical protein M422DRAFT_247381 [Sphaerobolus stellatus SS14]